MYQKIKGTCTEMCPKVEIKFRVKNKLVSVYELKDGKPDQSKFIKEYTRSAAGKEEIKMNELRTEDGNQNDN